VAAEPLGEQRWIALLQDDRGVRFAAALVLASDGVRRAVPGDGAAEALVSQLASGAAPVGTTFEWTVTGAARPAHGERAMGVDQTHESVVVGESAVVKWSVGAARSPAPLVLAHLHAVGFGDVPQPWGFVERDGALVAAVDTFLPGAVDGWTWCVDEVERSLSAAEGSRDTDAVPRRLGDLVGRLHVALAAPSRVLPEPVGRAGRSEAAGWHRRAVALLERAITTVPGPEGDRLRGRADQAKAVLDGILDAPDPATIHAHGDLHVGQILRWSGGYAVTDFDGNPVLDPSARLAREPAARDVAGMLQSLDHAGRVAVRRRAGVDAPSAAHWVRSAQCAFLEGYRAALDPAGAGCLLDERLIAAFQVEQECREFAYAMSHRREWLYVPDAAFAALFAESAGTDSPRNPRSDEWTPPDS
jgi:maltokinase